MVTPTTYYSDYEPLAWFYNEVWGEELSKLALHLLEQLLLAHLCNGDRKASQKPSQAESDSESIQLSLPGME